MCPPRGATESSQTHRPHRPQQTQDAARGTRGCGGGEKTTSTQRPSHRHSHSITGRGVCISVAAARSNRAAQGRRYTHHIQCRIMIMNNNVQRVGLSLRPEGRWRDPRAHKTSTRDRPHMRTRTAPSPTRQGPAPRATRHEQIEQTTRHTTRKTTETLPITKRNYGPITINCCRRAYHGGESDAPVECTPCESATITSRHAAPRGAACQGGGQRRIHAGPGAREPQPLSWLWPSAPVSSRRYIHGRIMRPGP